MRFRFPAWGLLVLLTAVCAAVVGIAIAVRSKPEPPAVMLSRLPLDGASVLAIDFHALREAGLLRVLAGAGSPQEPEYRTFVEQTGFDYQHDLDLALVSFHTEGTFYLLRGRFDWKSLRGYVTRQGGTCRNTACRMPGSTPERWISFFPVQPNLMALAVSKDPWASMRLAERREPLPEEIPTQPVWAWLSASVLRQREALPAGVRLIAGPLGNAERITLALGPREDGIEVTLDVRCRDTGEAGSLTGRLTAITAAIREIAAKEKATEPAQLSGVLAAGTFRRQDRRVMGRWPLDRKFIEALAAGSSL